MEHGGHTHGGHGASMPSNVTHEPPPPSYFYHPEHTTLLYSHIILGVAAWCFALPIAVFLSIAKSRYTSLAHVVFSAVNGAAIFVGVLYNANTPDLYENNVHHKLGWIFSIVAGAHSLMAIVRTHAPKSKAPKSPVFTFSMAHYKPTHAYNWSRDSGVGSSEGNISPRESLPGSPGFEEVPTDMGFTRTHEPEEYHDAEFEDEINDEGRGLLGTGKLNRTVGPFLKTVAGSKAMRVFGWLYETVNRLSLFLGFTLVTTGIVTYGGIFTGNEIFSGLAHFIKGGIFFWYGLLTLGRVMGSFGEFGWSWNMKPTAEMVGPKSARAPSLEFLESFLIFFYGITNVFLEHLGSQDGSWSAQDLEHVSIAIMFLGGGICGMLVESKKIRAVLNSTVTVGGHPAMRQEPRTYGFSLNPMPALIIMLLGIMMSSHHQESMVSTMLHSQWGTLFVAASLARGVTYLLVYLSPPASYLPSRPPSEIVVAFCFTSGGLIFMCSNMSMVEGMENLDLNAMFLFTVLMGLTAFIMAWEIVVLAIKGLALQREQQAATGRTLSSASTQA